MKHSVKLIISLLLCAIVMTGCCSHAWEEANCEQPRTCSECGATEGEKGNHDWEKATCEHPKTCTVCGKEKGDIGDHKWKDATCTEPENCRYCGETRGKALGHQWSGLTCQECGETREDPGATTPTEAKPLEVPDGCFPFTAEEFLKRYTKLIAEPDVPVTIGKKIRSDDLTESYYLECKGQQVMKLEIYKDMKTGYVTMITVAPNGTNTYDEETEDAITYTAMTIPFAVDKNLTATKWNEAANQTKTIFQGQGYTSETVTINNIKVNIRIPDEGYIKVTCTPV